MMWKTLPAEKEVERKEEEGERMVFGQVVIGPPGSGKTTYCNGMSQFLQLIGRYSHSPFVSVCSFHLYLEFGYIFLLISGMTNIHPYVSPFLGASYISSRYKLYSTLTRLSAVL